MGEEGQKEQDLGEQELGISPPEVLAEWQLSPAQALDLVFRFWRGGILNGFNRLEREQIMKIAMEAWQDTTLRSCRHDTAALMNFLLRCYYSFVALRVHGDSAT